jgi:hypothetical protein
MNFGISDSSVSNCGFDSVLYLIQQKNHTFTISISFDELSRVEMLHTLSHLRENGMMDGS